MCRTENLALFLQELSPTNDINLVKSLMNLMDCLMDEFQDEAKIAQMEEREIITWLEVHFQNVLVYPENQSLKCVCYMNLN